MNKLPIRLDLPLLRSIFKPGIATKQLGVSHEDVLSEIMGYHDTGALPCWAVQYERPDLPDGDSVDWTKLYARSTERYDHIKLKWWAYRSLQIYYSSLIENPPDGVTVRLGLEGSIFHEKLISDVFVARSIAFPTPRWVPSGVAVECGDTEAEKMLLMAPAYSKHGLLFCVLPYSWQASSLAIVFYLGSRLADQIREGPRHSLWCYYCNPSLGVESEDGSRVSAWGRVSGVL